MLLAIVIMVKAMATIRLAMVLPQVMPMESAEPIMVDSIKLVQLVDLQVQLG